MEMGKGQLHLFSQFYLLLNLLAKSFAFSQHTTTTPYLTVCKVAAASSSTF
jgi:hypothetical protein